MKNIKLNLARKKAYLVTLPSKFQNDEMIAEGHKGGSNNNKKWNLDKTTCSHF